MLRNIYAGIVSALLLSISLGYALYVFVFAILGVVLGMIGFPFVFFESILADLKEGIGILLAAIVVFTGSALLLVYMALQILRKGRITFRKLLIISFTGMTINLYIATIEDLQTIGLVSTVIFAIFIALCLPLSSNKQA